MFCMLRFLYTYFCAFVALKSLSTTYPSPGMPGYNILFFMPFALLRWYFARFVQQCSFSQTQHLMAQETPAQIVLIVASTHPVPILDVLGRLPVRKVRDSKTIDTHLDLLLESAVAKLETSVKKMEKFARAADIMAPERLKQPLSRVPLSICCKFPALALVRSCVESKVYKCLQRACNAVPICPTFYLRHLKTTWPCGFLRSR